MTPGQPLAIPARCRCGCGQFARKAPMGTRLAWLVGHGQIHGMGTRPAYVRHS